MNPRFLPSWLAVFFLVSGCSYLTAVEKEPTLESRKELQDLFAADKRQLIDEVRRQREVIHSLEEEKRILLEKNLDLSHQVRDHELKQAEIRKEKQEAERKAQAQIALAIPESSGRLTEYDYHKQGVHAFTEGQYEAALANFNKAIALNPKFFEAFTNIGVVYLTLNRPEDARLYLRKALEIQPDFQYARNYLERAEKMIQPPQAESASSQASAP